MKARRRRKPPCLFPLLMHERRQTKVAKLEVLVAQLDEHFDNLEQGQRWIIGLLFTITILVKMP